MIKNTFNFSSLFTPIASKQKTNSRIALYAVSTIKKNNILNAEYLKEFLILFLLMIKNSALFNIIAG